MQLKNDQRNWYKLGNFWRVNTKAYRINPLLAKKAEGNQKPLIAPRSKIYNNENSPDDKSYDSANLSRIGGTPTCWIHGSSIHLLQIRRAHYKSCDTNRSTADYAEYTKNKN